MNTDDSLNKAQNFWILAGLSVVVFVWFSVLLGVSGLFFTPLIIFAFSLIGTLFLFLTLKTLSLLDLPEKMFIVLLIGIALISVLPGRDNPSIFTGRDQGSIATAAIALAQHHSFAFALPVVDTFFVLHEPGLAQNFPGFFYTNDGRLLTQFPLAYTAWIGSFFLLFALNGLAIGNAVLLSLSLVSFYLLLRHFVTRFIAFFGSLLFATSFLPVWFAKITLSENLALFLFLLACLALVQFQKSGRFLAYIATLAAVGLFCLTRIEGWAILVITFLILRQLPAAKRLWQRAPKRSLWAPLVLFGFTFLVTIRDSLPFYTIIGKALRDFFLDLTTSGVALASSHSPLVILGTLFFSYGLLLVFLCGFGGIALLIRHRASVALTPFLLALPTFLYLFFPSITLDHPWMLRRYFFTLYPALVFSAVVGLTLFFNTVKTFPLEAPAPLRRRLIFGLLFLGLFLFQWPAWHRGLLTWDNYTLLRQTRTLSESFGPHDLILIDRQATGSPFAMLPGPLTSLEHKNAAYLFDPTDLERLDRTAYEHTWLIIPANDLKKWQEAMPSLSLTPKRQLSFGSIALGDTTIDISDLRFPEVTPFGQTNVMLEIE